MEKGKQSGIYAYLAALTMWLSVSLIRYTYFKDFFSNDAFRAVYYVALVLLMYTLVLKFRFGVKQIAGLFLLILFVMIAWSSGRTQFMVMFVLVYCAGYIPFEKILKTTLVVQLVVFFLTLIASQIGILEDYVWMEITRLRHALGFTHCMLASHFGLFVSLIYIALVKKMTWWRALFILLGNIVLYFLSYGRTDLYLSVLFVILAYAIGNLSDRLRYEKIWARLLSVLPFVLWGISVYVTWMYSVDREFFVKLDAALNNRLDLGKSAMDMYGFSMFGQKIEWIGASLKRYGTTMPYNYVDNSFLMMGFSYGVLFIFCYCLAMGYVLYKKTMQKDTMTVVCLLVILAFGMLNPQSMYLTYNPFLALLAMAWNPSKKEEVMYEG